jgi:hypothetical protein
VTSPNPTYDPYEAPPAGEATSRFALTATPAGRGLPSLAAVVSQVYRNLLADRLREAPPPLPEPVTVVLKFPVRDEDGWRLAHRGEVRGVPSAAPNRPGKFAKLTVGPNLLDEAFLGIEGGAFEKARDDAIWESLIALCRDLDPTPDVVRSLVDSVASLVCLRAGLIADAPDLPYPAHMTLGSGS